MATTARRPVRRTRTRANADPAPEVDTDQMLDDLGDKVAELYEGLNETNEDVRGLGLRLESLEKRPTFSPAALKRMSEKLSKLEIK